MWVLTLHACSRGEATVAERKTSNEAGSTAAKSNGGVGRQIPRGAEQPNTSKKQAAGIE